MERVCPIALHQVEEERRHLAGRPHGEGRARCALVVRVEQPRVADVDRAAAPTLTAGKPVEQGGAAGEQRIPWPLCPYTMHKEDAEVEPLFHLVLRLRASKKLKGFLHSLSACSITSKRLMRPRIAICIVAADPVENDYPRATDRAVLLKRVLRRGS
jgi:hypothetical protein